MTLLICTYDENIEIYYRCMPVIDTTTGSIDDLARMLFVADVVATGSIDVSVEGTRCAKDLFMFSVALFAMGLAMRCSHDTTAIPLFQVTAEDVTWVTQRMAPVGIVPQLHTSPSPINGVLSINMDTWEYLPDDMPLEAYECKLFDGINGCVHTVTFRLRHANLYTTCR
jgi:hypothetical protein